MNLKRDEIKIHDSFLLLMEFGGQGFFIKCDSKDSIGAYLGQLSKDDSSKIHEVFSFAFKPFHGTLNTSNGKAGIRCLQSAHPFPEPSSTK